MKILNFAPEHYPALTTLWNTVYPDYPMTIEEKEHRDQSHSEQIKWERFVAEVDGQIVAATGYSSLSVANINKFMVYGDVLPEYKGKGIGSMLYDHLWSAVSVHDPIMFITQIRENDKPRLTFLQERGFFEKQRDRESYLHMENFNPSDWQKEIDAVLSQKIVIKSYAQLKEETADIDTLHHQIDDLHWEINRDIPSPTPPVRTPYEEFLKRFDRPGFLPDGQFYAIDGELLVGASMLWANQGSDTLNTGLTGTRREYRKRGIASALKVRALTWAKEQGAPLVRTFNEVNNNGMLGINIRLGFIAQPEWLFMVKQIKEETDV